MSTEDALRHGISRTAGVVSAAALVMVGVFSLFGPASALDLKEAGVGLAVAVLLDATVVRGVLLPASMKLLGERNWYLPGGRLTRQWLRACARSSPSWSWRRFAAGSGATWLAAHAGADRPTEPGPVLTLWSARR